MRLNEIAYSNAEPVDGYGPGFFRIGNTLHHGAVVTGPDGSQPWGGFADADRLLAFSGKIDVFLVGTGAEIAQIPAGLRAQLEEAGIGTEVMNSPAACRTYNVLLAEGRRVALALLPV